MKNHFDVVVIGAGIFGVTAVSELQSREYKTALLDPGPLPHPLAASTDISKVIRMEYGHDETYMAMVEAALPLWRQLNERVGTTLYHEVGVTMFTRQPMAPGGYEYESFQMLQKRGHAPERLNADEISHRFPAWKPGAYIDGFYHHLGGFAESGQVVTELIKLAQKQGTALFAGQTVNDLVRENGRITHINTFEGETFHAGEVVVAAGAWTPLLVPELAPIMAASGHPVFHLETAVPKIFTPPTFTVFTADIANSGWYGFPLHPHENVIKVANHGVGQRLHPSHDTRIVTQEDEVNLRHFLADTFPDLAEAPIVYTRRCLYCDTLDEHFLITRHPEIDNLTISSGGSGHGFKFGQILGMLTAAAVAREEHPWLQKFRWRDLSTKTTGEEAARYHG